jgi:hypothetical protein
MGSEYHVYHSGRQLLRRYFLDAFILMMYYAAMSTKFQDLERLTTDDIVAAIKRQDPHELSLIAVTVALLSQDWLVAQDVCINLCDPVYDNKVRGNAVMSLGHLARRFRSLDEQTVKPIIESALLDADEYVRIHAKSAADEIHQFLGWIIAGHVYAV